MLYEYSSFVLTPINTDLYDFLLATDSSYGDSPVHIGYHGPYYIHELIEEEYTLLKTNPNYHDPEEYFIDNYLFSVVTSSERTSLFTGGYLDVSTIHPSVCEYSYGCSRMYEIPGSTTYSMNLNRLGTVENQLEQFPNSTYVPEPILANNDFVLAMFFGLNREHLTSNILNGSRLSNMYYFNKLDVIDPTTGLKYRSTEQGMSVGEDFFSHTQGYDFATSHELFLTAIESLIEDGTYEKGTEDNYTIITLDLMTFANSPSWTSTVEYIKTEYETNFVDDVNFIKVEFNITYAGFPDIYYDYMMVGEFDISIGGISGGTLCPECILDNYCSDNRSEFLLNWGNDTSIPEIIVEYVDHEGNERKEIFSYDAIVSLLNGEVTLVEGQEQQE